jgi:predicted acyl esterase
MRQSTDRRTARPVRPAAAAVSKMICRAWSLPPRRTFVAVERDIQVPMSDGTVLLADHYLPITSQPAATVLVRCPYGRGAPFSLLNAQLIAERGFHVLLQSCRGTFGSGGRFEPMRGEISDGQDTVAWLRGQSWFNGRLATFGPSYLGFVQWALAMDPPPELAAAVVFVGPHDFSRTAYRNGAFDLYNFLSWSDLIIHQERVNPLSGLVRTVTADRRLRPALDRSPVSAGARDLLGDQAPWFDTWHADLFVRLCDVDPRGRSRNVCDCIVRLTDTDPLSGTVRVSLIGAAHRFGPGHRLRLQVAGGAHPRFARNPGNGQVDAPAKDFVATRYSIGLSAENPSALVVSQTAGKAAAHA